MTKTKTKAAAGDDSAAAAVSGMVDAISEAKQPKQPQYDGIAILGSHPATVMQAPFDDPAWLIYACSPHNIEMRTLPRVDEWFEVHLPVTHPTRQYGYLRSLEDNNVAINPPHAKVIWARDPQFGARVRDARPYPEKEMKERFCPFLFNSSIAYMMAKSIVDCERLGITEIGLFGILQASDEEWNYQRPSTQYFIWEASKRGIRVGVPETEMAESRARRLFDLPPENW